MATSPFFSGRIPQLLFDAVEQYRQSNKKSKTEVLKDALSAYLGLPPEPLTPLADGSRLEDLENRLALVERVLNNLANVPGENSPGHFAQLSAPVEIEQQVEPEEQLSLESIQPIEVEETDEADNSDNIDNSSQEPDSKAESTDNSSDNGNHSEFWASSQVEKRLGIARKTLETWNKRGNLPRAVKGYTIVGLVEKQKINGRWQNTWEICKTQLSPLLPASPTI